ncbi:MAG: hypothetical protein Phog2KO_45250 [Phototrophicaceae bacterium]
MSKHVFISYARSDGEAFAKKVYDFLELQGLKPWMDKRGGIRPSTRWDNEIQQAIDDCSLLIFVMTPGGIESENCHDEWSYALNQGKQVVPLHVIKSDRIPMRLHRIQYIDFVTIKETTAFKMMLDRLNEDHPATSEDSVIDFDDTVRIFISYKHRDEDEEILEELKSYMEQDIKDVGGVFWYDEGIDWGDNWHSVIKQEVEKADIALLLVSQAYLSSEYVKNEEIADFLLKKQQDDAFLLLPLILEHCRWKAREWLSSTQSLPGDRKLPTVKEWRKADRHDELYLNITDALVKHVEIIRGKKREKAQRTRVEVSQDVRDLQTIVEKLNTRPDGFPAWCLIRNTKTTIGDNSLADTPEHEVEINAFLISETPITQAQYQQFLMNSNHRMPSDEDFFPDYSWTLKGRIPQPPKDKLQHPVVLVSAQDAQAYCEWLTKQLFEIQELDGDWQVQLPSEVEWEYAARGNSPADFPYPWGVGAPDKTVCNFNGHFNGTTPVKQFSKGKSPLGVHDMVGNVWEWTRSFLLDYPYIQKDTHEDETMDIPRVLRGGSWQADANLRTLRPAYRYAENLDFVYDTVGFRVVICKVR